MSEDKSVVELESCLRAVLSYWDDRPTPGTFGGEVFAKAETLLAKLQAEREQPAPKELAETLRGLLHFDEPELRLRLYQLANKLEFSTITAAAEPDVDLTATVNVTVKCPHGTTLDGNSIVLPGGVTLRVRPTFELCDDVEDVYQDLSYKQLTALGVYYEIQRVEVEPDL